MLTKTLQDGLSRYQIGPRLRTLRLKKKIGLVELGKHTGLSPALLSKVERGRLFPTLPTLLRISLVFGVGLDHFFNKETEPEPLVVKKSERIQFPARPGQRRQPYHFESLDYPATDRPISCYFVKFENVEWKDSTPHQHPGVELIYVIEGSLTVSVAGTEYPLETGDSMYFRGHKPHAYRKTGGRSCAGVVITSP